MIRVLLYIAGILILAYGASWMADHPGAVTITFVEWQVTTTFAFLGLLVALLMAFAAFLIWMVGYLARELPLVGSNRVIKRQSRGLVLLNRSLIALSTGEPALARRLVEEAEILLPPQPMVLMIAAEAATRLGDKREAAKRFEALRSSEDGKVLGLRGLVQQAEKAGHSKEALLLAREALAESSSNPWALKAIFSLEVKAAEWDNALKTLKTLEMKKLSETDEVLHHRSALYYARAVEQKVEGQNEKARKDFQEALKTRPSFTEAHVASARLDFEAGKSAVALKQLKAAWTVRPHKALRDQLLAFNPTATTAASLVSVRDLTVGNPQHLLSQLVISEALDRDGQGEAAEDMLGRVKEKMGLKPYEVVPDDSSFQCLNCGHRQEHWSLSCESCADFNSLRWFDAFDADLTTLKTVRQEREEHSVLLMSE
ncbi:heme biosynthesis HemY N-terminal domain-containing protein [Temperatibacter marinus]|uniref:Heme biosynthesis HemY N-terminal domain-containing protein n=1 Tax=Temperatibacter marinus TaxID=1456591 RepID=A0AA52EJR6_9PROT|nr:heme biosynthesis HemY N-terminal domain-containing protein [Temperatibacter marinus]WND03754.1 heme biosynthesis HemY N-terminal domain-containing protein [Temperatibacter marinus]